MSWATFNQKSFKKMSLRTKTSAMTRADKDVRATKAGLEARATKKTCSILKTSYHYENFVDDSQIDIIDFRYFYLH